MSQNERRTIEQHEMEEVLRMIEENRRTNEARHEENIDKLDCLAVEMRRFVRNYEETLKRAKGNNEQWDDIKRDLIKKSVTGAWIWLIGLLGVAFFFYVKEHLR